MVGNKLDTNYILITSSNFPHGGAGANYLNLFCKGVKLQNYKIKVFLLKGFLFGNFLSNHKRKNITDEGVPFIYLGFVKRPNNIFFKFLDELLSGINLLFKLISVVRHRKNTIILVYNNELQSNILIYFFAEFFNIKLITFVPEFYGKYVFKGSFLRKLKWYGFLFNFYFLNKLSFKLIVFSHYLKDQYISKGFKDADIIVQPNLTDFDFWEIKHTPQIYTIGYSGSPSIKDGLHDLFKAISILKHSGLNVTLLVIGDSPFGDSLIPDLKIECIKLGIGDDINFSGLVELSRVKTLLGECGILALTRPSTIQTQAGFPTKLGEYFASKKQVLVTNFGDVEKYFQSNIDVVMAQSGNVNEIAEKIKWMVENKEHAEEIKRNGYKTAASLLEYKSSVKRVINLCAFDS